MSKSPPRRDPRRGAPPDEPAGPLPPAGRVGAILAVSALTILALPWLARHDASNWAWGLNVVRYLPPGTYGFSLGLGLAALALGILLAALPWTPAAGRTAPANRPAPGSAFFSRRGLPLQALLCALVVAAAWVCREQVHFLSDTLLRMRSMYRMSVGEGPVSALVLHAAPLDYYLTVRLPVWLAGTRAMDIFQAAQLVPCLLGAAFAWAAIRFAARAAETAAGRALALAVLLTQGYMELFAGYCKGHGLLLTALLAWCVAVAAEQRAGRKPGWSVFLFGVALLSHRSALLLAPAQAWLAWRANREPTSRAGGGARPRARARSWAVVFVGASAVLLGLSWSGVAHRDLGLLGRVWRAGAEPGAYRMLSAAHAADVLNDLFLLAPLGIAAVLLAVFARGGRRVPGWGALVVGGAPFLGAAVLVSHRFAIQGAVRDWDNFASAGLFLALFAAVLVGRAVDRNPRLAALAGAVVLAGALHTGAWLHLNADTGEALARVDAIGRAAPPLPLSARAMLYEYLGEYFELEDQPAASAESYLRATELAPNPRFYFLGGTQLWKAGQRARAAQAFRTAARRDPGTGAKMLLLAERKLAIDPADSMQQAIREAASSVPGPSLRGRAP